MDLQLVHIHRKTSKGDQKSKNLCTQINLRENVGLLWCDVHPFLLGGHVTHDRLLIIFKNYLYSQRIENSYQTVFGEKYIDLCFPIPM